MFGYSRRFKQYLNDHWRDLYRVAYVWTHDRDLASDLVQETITRSLKNRQKFSNETELRAWLFRVMSNCWHDHFRRQKDTVDLESTKLYSTTNLENEHYRQQVMQQVIGAFDILKSEYREALSLVVIEGMAYDEIAKVLNIPIGTVMSRVSRARAQLKGLLKDVHINENLTDNVWRIK